MQACLIFDFDLPCIVRREVFVIYTICKVVI